MIERNQKTIKLGKSLLKLKDELLTAPTKLLPNYTLPFRTVKLPKQNCEYKLLKNEISELCVTNKKAHDLGVKENKNSFGRLVDFAKSIVHSNTPVTIKHPHINHLVSLINRAQQEGHYQRLLCSPRITSTPLMNENKLKHSINTNKQMFISRRECSTSNSELRTVGRHRYHKDVENAVNEQILAEINACYAYLSIACYFGRTDVALPGCYGFFMLMHEEEHEHTLIFINYQNKRGGHVKLCPIGAPPCHDWQSIKNAICVAVEMEKSVKEKLISLHDVAEKHHDLSTMDLVTNHFMEEQERSICELARLLVRVTKMGGSPEGEFLFDKEIHRAFVKKSGKNFDPIAEQEKKDTYKLYT